MSHLSETLAAYQARDPAARSKLEIFLLYPGVHATLYHQAAHFCYCHKMKFLARTISQWSRFWTDLPRGPPGRHRKGPGKTPPHHWQQCALVHRV